MEEVALAHIKTKMVLANMNQRTLAKKLKRSQSWVSRHLDNLGSMTLDDFFEICKILHIKLQIGE